MTPDQMTRALELERKCDRAMHLLRNARLAERTSGYPEQISLAVVHGNGNHTRELVDLSDEVCWFAFRDWRQRQARHFNTCVRELAQLGATTSHRALSFHQSTGEPIL